MTMTLRTLLQASRTRTAYGGRAFSSAAPTIWNNLPTSVIEANSLSVFRRRLKTHLFTVAFEANVVNCNVASASVSVRYVWFYGALQI